MSYKLPFITGLQYFDNITSLWDRQLQCLCGLLELNLGVPKNDPACCKWWLNYKQLRGRDLCCFILRHKNIQAQKTKRLMLTAIAAMYP